MNGAPVSDRPTTRRQVIWQGFSWRVVALAVLPLALLGSLVAGIALWGNRLLGPSPIPAEAISRLDIERLDFWPGEIRVRVINSGPADLTVAQVFVNESIWDFAISPGATIPRLGRATISIPYPWLEGEPHTVKIITANGLTFTREVAVAAPAPEPGLSSFLLFAVLGLYVGVLPIYLGLIWFPLLRRLSQGLMDFVLALTVGLLIFLGLDMTKEALDLAERLPGPFRGTGLVGIGVVGAFLALAAVSRRPATSAGQAEARQRLTLAYLIALGIGLHNLGEGLAIGAAYAVGELVLGALLILGFTIHNTTEGPAIVAPVLRYGAGLRHLVLLGLLAGGPTLLGAWLGAFTYSDIWGTLFLAIGAGAIFQVVFAVARLPGREGPGWLATPTGFTGLLAGMLIMYATGLLVTV